jgi:hypothetical protein
MTRSRKILIVGGLALAAFSMFYGVYYALFVEHQTLDGMGTSLATSFIRAAERNLPESQASLNAFIATKYNYVRQIDCHSHWIGLATLMLVLGMAFDHVALSESVRQLLAWSLLLGSILFPLAVILQATNHGPLFRVSAIIGSALIIVSLAGVAAGFARQAPH